MVAQRPGIRGGNSDTAGESGPVRRGPRLLTSHDAAGTVGWSLVAANGRHLACSATRYRDDGELVAALRELRADRRVLRYAVVQRLGRWSWTARLPARRAGVREGEPIASSARSYLRQDQCRKGTEVFLRALDDLPSGAWSVVLTDNR
ncbi:hypothetical protein [Streptomyces sp. NPDC049040]|uniref:hypothetical protein n=1 Tax=Streptomyces sp. NPDC049040 TaxID=3365593 RepID=UPI00371001CD